MQALNSWIRPKSNGRHDKAVSLIQWAVFTQNSLFNHPNPILRTPPKLRKCHYYKLSKFSINLMAILSISLGLQKFQETTMASVSGNSSWGSFINRGYCSSLCTKRAFLLWMLGYVFPTCFWSNKFFQHLDFGRNRQGDC